MSSSHICWIPSAEARYPMPLDPLPAGAVWQQAARPGGMPPNPDPSRSSHVLRVSCRRTRVNKEAHSSSMQLCHSQAHASAVVQRHSCHSSPAAAALTQQLSHSNGVCLCAVIGSGLAPHTLLLKIRLYLACSPSAKYPHPSERSL